MPARSFCLNTCCLQIIDWTIISEKYIIISQKKWFCSKATSFLEEISCYLYTNKSNINFRAVPDKNRKTPGTGS